MVREINHFVLGMKLPDLDLALDKVQIVDISPIIRQVNVIDNVAGHILEVFKVSVLHAKRKQKRKSSIWKISFPLARGLD